MPKKDEEITDQELNRAVAEKETKTLCADLDSGCDEVHDYRACYLYDPAKGMCPYVSLKAIDGNG